MQKMNAEYVSKETGEKIVVGDIFSFTSLVGRWQTVYVCHCCVKGEWIYMPLERLNVLYNKVEIGS